MSSFWTIMLFIHFIGAIIIWMIDRNELQKELGWVLNDVVIDIIVLFACLFVWYIPAFEHLFYYFSNIRISFKKK